MGGGRSEGANPGPLLPTYLTDWGLFDRNELSAHCPESSQLRQSGTTDLVGDWWGTEEITNDDDASSPTHPAQWREAKERKVRVRLRL